MDPPARIRRGGRLTRGAPPAVEPIDRLTGPLERFLHVEAAGGIALLACTAIALVVANSPLGDAYHHWWQTPVGIEIGSFRLRYSLEHWVNEGLMTLFFFLVGLEVKRELVLGDLRDPRSAALPVAGALGGMIVPAAIYALLVGPGPAARGWGVPMATDIAFVVGCMAVLGERVPGGLRVALLTLAIADDIGAILVIALGYNAGVAVVPLALGCAGLAVVVLFRRVGIRSFAVYAMAGTAVWLAFARSGVHATIVGVLLGLLTPAQPRLPEGTLAQFVEHMRDLLSGEGWPGLAGRAAHLRTLRRTAREFVSPLEYLESVLHPWVSFVIMPVFALANAAVPFQVSDFADRTALAVAAGLLIGKAVGIVAASWLAVRTGVARLPVGVSWVHMAGGSALCGIGFTMALFIANLALEGSSLGAAKVGILVGSALAATTGMVVLGLTRHPAAGRS